MQSLHAKPEKGTKAYLSDSSKSKLDKIDKENIYLSKILTAGIAIRRILGRILILTKIRQKKRINPRIADSWTFCGLQILR